MRRTYVQLAASSKGSPLWLGIDRFPPAVHMRRASHVPGHALALPLAISSYALACRWYDLSFHVQVCETLTSSILTDGDYARPAPFL